jgi:hypothetical protein
VVVAVAPREFSSGYQLGFYGHQIWPYTVTR